MEIESHGDIQNLLANLIQHVQIRQECLIHGDYNLGNILEMDGHYTIIDWTNGQYGDPSYGEMYRAAFACSASYNTYTQEEGQVFEAMACLRWILLKRVGDVPMGPDVMQRRSVIDMEQKVQSYFELKQQQKDIEQQLSVLRDEIVAYCAEQGVYETQVGGYTVKTVLQNRKEYDDQKLYASLPDPDIWRLLSKVDSHKLKSLIKLNILSEEQINPACTVKQVTLLQVDKL
ncbi:hypothetical protein HK101_011573 [Irineochytrium annulatum]|nr:hypothetical protein HK101_011573 [Irineochytrium annulatum]